MSGLILIAVLWIWFLIAKSLSGFFTQKMQLGALKKLVRVLLFALILAAPVLDEIIGNKVFYSECEKLSPVKFYGAASIGEGFYFNSDGTPKWKTDEEYYEMTASDNGRYRRSVIELIESKQIIRKFPIKIELEKNQYYGKHTQSLVFEMVRLYSEGGWIHRSLIGLWSPYSCRSTGEWPEDQFWITF